MGRTFSEYKRGLVDQETLKNWYLCEKGEEDCRKLKHWTSNLERPKTLETDKLFTSRVVEDIPTQVKLIA